MISECVIRGGPRLFTYLKVFSVAAQETSPTDLFFRPDGRKMYVIGESGDAVKQYSLSTAWDIETASYDGVSLAINVGNTGPKGLFFKPDGTKMYVIGGQTSGNIEQWSLPAAWELTGGTYDSVEFADGAEAPQPSALAFKPDGSKMYLISPGTDVVSQYTLGTPWNVSTASYDAVDLPVGTEDGSASGICFNSDGTQLYMIGVVTFKIYRYQLSVAWDLSTATYTGFNQSVFRQNDDPQGLALSNDDTKMYIIGKGSQDKAVYQYAVN